MYNDYRDFPEFYENEFIKSISGNACWSVSDNNKVPINMRALIDEQKIYGARFDDNQNPCTTLDEIITNIPNVSNHAYYLDSIVSDFVVLDVEPKCPDAIKQELLNLPYIYGEISMSGHGYHLVFPLPESIKDYPAAQTKPALKDDNGYYEILLNHWVTFTRKMIPLSNGTNDFTTIFNNLASQAKAVTRNDISFDDEKPDDIPYMDELVSILMKQHYNKTLSDFPREGTQTGYDNSTYEYAHIGFISYKLSQLLNVSKYKEHEYTDTEKAWIIYSVASDVIPHRAKHDEERNGLPWLMYLTQELLCKS